MSDRLPLVSIDRKELLEQVNLLAGVTPRRPANDATRCIALTINEQDLTVLQATDNECWLTTRLQYAADAACESAIGETQLIPAHQLHDLLRRSKAETVDLERVGNNTRIEADRASFTLPSGDPDEFPSPPDPDVAAGGWLLDPGQFRQAIRRTTAATESKTIRYALAGVRLEFGDESFTVATDGRRLHVQEIAADPGGSPPPGAPLILPLKSLSLLDRCLAIPGFTLSEANLHLQFPPGRAQAGVIFDCGKFSLLTRNVEGQFPPWREIEQAEAERDGPVIEFEAGGFRRAVGQAAVTLDETSRAVEINLDSLGDNLIGLHSSAIGVGDSMVILEVGVLRAGNPPIEDSVAIDCRHLRDILNPLAEDATVRLDFSAAPKRVVKLMTDDGFRACIAPIFRSD